MTDPHIDIDDVDNSNSNYAGAGNNSDGIPVGGPGAGFTPNFTEYANGFFNILERLRSQSGFGSGNGLDPLSFESRKHFRNSQREFLLGWRTVIDDAIHRLDERETREAIRQSSEPLSSNGRSSGTKIEVEEIED